VVKQNFSEFELIVIRSQNELGTAVLLVLAWIAASDGSVDEREAKHYPKYLLPRSTVTRSSHYYA